MAVTLECEIKSIYAIGNGNVCFGIVPNVSVSNRNAAENRAVP